MYRSALSATLFAAVSAVLVLVALSPEGRSASPSGEDRLDTADQPFVVLGNWSGEVWLFPFVADSVGAGTLVHHFQNAAASGLAIIDHGLDGDLDILAMVQPKDAYGALTGDTDIYLFENKGPGFEMSLLPESIRRSSGFWFPMSDICAEDFLADGYDDFIVSVTGDSRTMLYLFVWDPSSHQFRQSLIDDTPWADHAWLIDAGEVHDDSFRDFITFDYPTTGDFADEVFVYRGDGLGGFTESFACSTIHSVNDIAVGDYNNDGHADFTVGVDDDGNPGAVWLYLGDGTGLFKLSSPSPVFDLDPVHNSGEDRTGTGHMDSYDVDQDGNLDLLAYVHGKSRQPYNPSLYFVRGNGDGSFQPPVRVYEAIGDLSLPLALATALIAEEGVSELHIDVKPRSCPNPINVKSKGVLPVAILGTASLDVREIEAGTILLEGVRPLRTALEDVSRPVGGGGDAPSSSILSGMSTGGSGFGAGHDRLARTAGSRASVEAHPEPAPELEDSCDCTTEGPDGIDDLTMKFDTQEIVAALGDVGDRDTLLLRVTARLADGDELSGWDCVVIIDNEERKAERQVPDQVQLRMIGASDPTPSGLVAIHPNPLRSTTAIKFSLGEKGHARLTIQDLSGRTVGILVDGVLPAGVHSTIWKGDAPAGIYICRFEGAGSQTARKVVLLR